MAALTTVNAVKAAAGITVSDVDSLIHAFILRASAAVEKFCQRSLLSQVHTELRDGTGNTAMLLRESPVTAVTSVTIDGVLVPQAPAFGDAGWRLADRQIVLTGYRFARGQKNVELVYTAGDATVPPDVEGAVIETVQLMLERRKHVDVSSKSLAGETVSFITAELTPSAKQILINHQRVALI
jgi:hypothetical protein